jgi:hypothetical protein
MQENTKELFDCYYSAAQAKLNKNLCHSVQDTKFTITVPEGMQPTGQFDDLVLVAKSIKYEDVRLNPDFIKQNKKRFGWEYKFR